VSAAVFAGEPASYKFYAILVGARLAGEGVLTIAFADKPGSYRLFNHFRG
jgi:hypothetical protein